MGNWDSGIHLSINVQSNEYPADHVVSRDSDGGFYHLLVVQVLFQRIEYLFRYVYFLRHPIRIRQSRRKLGTERGIRRERSERGRRTDVE